MDIVLIDVILPDVSGIKLLEFIREKLGKKIKYIYFTIVPEDEFEKGDIDGFVQKPSLPKILEDEVDNA